MGFSLETAIIVPVAIVLITAVSLKSFGAYQDVRLNAIREAKKANARLHNTEVYRLCFREDGLPADARTNPLSLLRFCIYLEDQTTFLLEVFDDDSE